MRKVLIVSLLLAMVLCVKIVPAWAQDGIAGVDAAWVKRSGSLEQNKQMLAMAEKAFADGGGYEAAWRAARSAFWICDRTTDKKIKEEFGKKGWDWGTKAIELAPARVEGYYYGCISLGEYGTGIGILRAVTKGLGGKYEKLGNQATTINASFDMGGPYRAMGRYYQLLPKPLRNLTKAEELYKKNDAIAACMIRTKFYLVELYMEREDWDKARATADAALANPGCAGYQYEDNFYKEEIKKLQKKFPAK